MNKKGFTLTELLGVIVVLAIIIGIAGMSALTIIRKARNKANEENEYNLKEAAKIYAKDNEKYGVSIPARDLINEGLFDDDNGKCKDVSVTVEYDSSIHDYKATLNGYCED